MATNFTELRDNMSSHRACAHDMARTDLSELWNDPSFRAALRKGVAQADRGEFVEAEEMNARFEKMLRS